MIERVDAAQSNLFEESSGETIKSEGKKQGGKKRSSSKAAQAVEFGLKAPSQLVKNFVLDTNVLIHDPSCLGRFKEHHLCSPVDVLAELDRFKSEQSERGANARRVHRQLTELFSCSNAITAGVPTEGGGTVRMVIYDPTACPKNSEMLNHFHRVFPDRERVDHRIMAATLLLMEHNAAPVILVTKDINLQLKARAVGIDCEDYLNDKVDPREVTTYDIRRIPVDANEMQRFASSGELVLPHERRPEVVLNQYVLLEASEKQTMPARLASEGRLVRLQIPEALKIPDGVALKPLNLGQRCLIDALLNPEISLVTCYGHAGTGKHWWRWRPACTRCSTANTTG